MEYTATFSTKGQLTFPSGLRRAIGIKSGSHAQFVKHNKETGEITLRIVDHKKTLKELAGCLKTNMPYVPYEVAREIAGQDLGAKYKLNNND